MFVRAGRGLLGCFLVQAFLLVIAAAQHHESSLPGFRPARTRRRFENVSATRLTGTRKTPTAGICYISYRRQAAVFVHRWDTCERGSYRTALGNGTSVCRKCSLCPKGHRERKPCGGIGDVACQPCGRGHYLDTRSGRCDKCSSCPLGHGVLRRCKRDADTVCVRCKKLGRFFSDRQSSHSRCKFCRTCQPFERVLRKCKGVNDTVCGNCRRGYFRHAYRRTCEKCSPCYPNVTFRVAACVHRAQLPTDVCMPVFSPWLSKYFVPEVERPSLPESITKHKETEREESIEKTKTLPKWVIWFLVAIHLVISTLITSSIIVKKTRKSLHLYNWKKMTVFGHSSLTGKAGNKPSHL